MPNTATRIDSLTISLRLFKRLRAAHVETLEELAEWSEPDLLMLPGLGAGCVQEVTEVLAAHHLTLAPARLVSPYARIPSPVRRKIVAAYAKNRSLRRVAQHFGCSHETVRTALREAAEDSAS